MKILGIELHTPSATGIVAAAVTTLLCGIIATAIVYLDLIPLNIAFAVILAAMGGSLSYAYGVSVRDHGLPGVVVTAGFCIVVMLLGVSLAVYSGLL